MLPTRDRLSRRCSRGVITIWCGAARSRAMTTVCCERWKPRSTRLDWKRRNACGFTSRSVRRRMIWAITPWPCSISTPRTCARRGSLSFDSAAFAIEIDRLIARCTPEWIARAINRTRQQRRNAGADPRHAAFRHNSRRADHLQSSRSGGGRRVAFLERARGGVAQPGRCRRPSRRSSPTRQQIISACSARDRAESAPRVTDKMPFNFLWAGLIHLAFPRATIIHCRRAAVDTGLSIHQTHFHPNLAFPTGGDELVMHISAATSGSPAIGGACCPRTASSMSITRS